MSKVYLYTPWQEQGLSYDARVMEKLFIMHGFESIITYRTKKKVKWDCEFVPIKEVPNIIEKGDVFFSFEVFPEKVIASILDKTDLVYHMVNYEYYEKDTSEHLQAFKYVFCKSNAAFEGLQSDGLNNLIYQPWILFDFPLSQYRPLSDADRIKAVFNGGTGGYKERRNLEAVINLISDYQSDNVHFTLKFTDDLQRWSHKLLKKHKRMLESDPRVSIMQHSSERDYYIKFLNGFDINIAPSRFEGFGLTLLEALHANLPTITLDVSPLNEIVENGVTGITVPADKTGRLREQDIYQVNRHDLLEVFTNMVSDRKALRAMKKAIPEEIESKVQNFVMNMGKLLFE